MKDDRTVIKVDQYFFSIFNFYFFWQISAGNNLLAFGLCAHEPRAQYGHCIEKGVEKQQQNKTIKKRELIFIRLKILFDFYF